ncbi:DUF4238 domain-containing protein [Flavobacterium sp. GCM10027622]|uniref:DUF4238 domain-containing protein n=1 Tax=unclassified Flavobacterium TaxID=196869 RepID=UPI00360E5BAD
MNNLSWRHHYLPVFYLKGFTKESRLIRVYDVEKKQFVQKGKEFSTESYFFEKNGNTIFYGDKQSDFIEKAYSDLENNISKILTRINENDSSNNFGINEYDVQSLNMFANLMFWRLPHRKDLLEIILKNTDLDYVGLKILDKDGVRKIESENEIKNNPEFLKAYKLFFSFADTMRSAKNKMPYNLLSRPEQLPFLCSDNPVIFEKEFPNINEDGYVFPLSGTRVFMKTSKQKDFPPYLWLLFDIISYKQAKKYVSCTSLEYIEMLEETFVKYKMSLEEFKIELFKRLK